MISIFPGFLKENYQHCTKDIASIPMKIVRISFLGENSINFPKKWQDFPEESASISQSKSQGFSGANRIDYLEKIERIFRTKLQEFAEGNRKDFSEKTVRISRRKSLELSCRNCEGLFRVFPRKTERFFWRYHQDFFGGDRLNFLKDIFRVPRREWSGFLKGNRQDFPKEIARLPPRQKIYRFPSLLYFNHLLYNREPLAVRRIKTDCIRNGTGYDE